MTRRAGVVVAVSPWFAVRFQRLCLWLLSIALVVNGAAAMQAYGDARFGRTVLGLILGFAMSLSGRRLDGELDRW